MPITKEQWLNQTLMCDEWGRPPSLADVPLTYMSREQMFEKRKTPQEEIDRIWDEMQKQQLDKKLDFSDGKPLKQDIPKRRKK